MIVTYTALPSLSVSESFQGFKHAQLWLWYWFHFNHAKKVNIYQLLFSCEQRIFTLLLAYMKDTDILMQFPEHLLIYTS